jgi:hypothetical protein
VLLLVHACRQLTHYHKAALQAYKTFWKALLHSDVSFAVLTRAFDSIERTQARAEKTYRLVLERYPESAKLYRAWARYQEVRAVKIVSEYSTTGSQEATTCAVVAVESKKTQLGVLMTIIVSVLANPHRVATIPHPAHLEITWRVNFKYQATSDSRYGGRQAPAHPARSMDVGALWHSGWAADVLLCNTHVA